MNRNSSIPVTSLTHEQRVSALTRLDPEQLEAVDRILRTVPFSPYLTTRETTRLLGISRATLHRWIALGKIRPLTVQRNRNLFPAGRVLALIDEKD